MKLTSSQEIIARDTHRYRVVCAGRRFGKTMLAVEEIIGKALSKPSQIAYIATTYSQARDIVWAHLKTRVQPIVISINESRLEITVKSQTGEPSKITLRGWESIETLRGLAFDFIIIDEVASMRNFWIGWQEVVRPTLTDRKGEVLFIGTPKGYNHFYDLYQLKYDSKPEVRRDWESFHFTTYDNPHIDKEEILAAQHELPDDRFSQEYMASFVKAEGLVYKEFIRNFHTYDDNTERHVIITDILLGVDFGYTNPTAVLKIEKDNEGNYWVAAEWYKTERTNIEIIEHCKAFNPNSVYADPAEPDRIAEMKKHGLNVKDVSKDITAGIDRVRSLFQEGRLKIHVDCKNLIEELETYSYPEGKEEKNKNEKPIKFNDHLLDALRYALYMHSNVPKKRKPVVPHWKGYSKMV